MTLNDRNEIANTYHKCAAHWKSESPSSGQNLRWSLIGDADVGVITVTHVVPEDQLEDPSENQHQPRGSHFFESRAEISVSRWWTSSQTSPGRNRRSKFFRKASNILHGYVDLRTRRPTIASPRYEYASRWLRLFEVPVSRFGSLSLVTRFRFVFAVDREFFPASRSSYRSVHFNVANNKILKLRKDDSSTPFTPFLSLQDEYYQNVKSTSASSYIS